MMDLYVSCRLIWNLLCVIDIIVWVFVFWKVNEFIVCVCERDCMFFFVNNVNWIFEFNDNTLFICVFKWCKWMIVIVVDFDKEWMRWVNEV